MEPITNCDATGNEVGLRVLGGDDGDGVLLAADVGVGTVGWRRMSLASLEISRFLGYRLGMTWVTVGGMTR